MNAPALVQKVWNYCHTLRDDGVGYGDYLEQLTFLLFLKMAHEYSLPPYSRKTQVPSGYDWESLVGPTGEALENQYRRILKSSVMHRVCLVRFFTRQKTKFLIR